MGNRLRLPRDEARRIVVVIEARLFVFNAKHGEPADVDGRANQRAGSEVAAQGFLGFAP